MFSLLVCELYNTSGRFDLRGLTPALIVCSFFRYTQTSFSALSGVSAVFSLLMFPGNFFTKLLWWTDIAEVFCLCSPKGGPMFLSLFLLHCEKHQSYGSLQGSHFPYWKCNNSKLSFPLIFLFATGPFPSVFRKILTLALFHSCSQASHYNVTVMLLFSPFSIVTCKNVFCEKDTSSAV